MPSSTATTSQRVNDVDKNVIKHLDEKLRKVFAHTQLSSTTYTMFFACKIGIIRFVEICFFQVFECRRGKQYE